MAGRKIIRIISIVVGTLAGLYLLVLLAAGIYFNTRKHELVVYINSQLGEKLQGNASIRDLDISVWRHFPSLSFEIKGFTWIDSVYKLPILKVDRLATKFSLFGLLRSKTTIHNLIAEKGELHLFTDSSGYSNQYLFQPKSPAATPKNAPAEQELNIEDLRLEDIAIIVEDRSKNKEISMQVDRLKASIRQTGQLLDIEMNEHITMKKGLGFNLAKGGYLAHLPLEAKWKLQIDKTKKTISFGETDVAIAGHPFKLAGEFRLGKTDPHFTIRFDVKQIPYNNVKAIVTDSIRKRLEMVQVAQPLDANGTIDGSLLPGEPAINVNCHTSENNLVIPGGMALTRCSFAGNFNNGLDSALPYGDPNSRIRFSGFSANWEGINIASKDISLTNLTEPILHFRIFSECLLKDLDEKFGLKDITLKSGNVLLDLGYDGPLTPGLAMTQRMEGRLILKDGVVDYTPRNFSFTNCNGVLNFYKDSISIKDLSCRYGNNVLNVELHGSNVRKKFLVSDSIGQANVHLQIATPFINLDDFDALFASETTRRSTAKPKQRFSATAQQIDSLLDNSVIDVNISAGTLRRGRLEARNLLADIRFEPRYWRLQHVSMDFAGGTISTNGLVKHVSPVRHEARLSVNARSLDIGKLLYAFNNFGQDALTPQNISGRFSTAAELTAGINSAGKLIPSSLRGTVNFTLKDGELNNFAALENIKVFVFKNRDFSHVKLAELKNKLAVDGSRITLNRMELTSSVLRLFLQGIYGLDKKGTDLLVQVPLSNLNDKNFDDDEAPEKMGLKKSAGASVWLRAVNGDDGKIKVRLTLSKKVKAEK